jgi:hypothetical protein
MLSTLLMNAVNSPLCLLSPIWIERFGRRPMFLSLTILSSLELAFVAAAQILLDINGGQPAGWFVAFLAIVGCTAGQASVNIGLLNMTPILVGELCPYAARSLLTQVTYLHIF